LNNLTLDKPIQIIQPSNGYQKRSWGLIFLGKNVKAECC